jgi:hypothetical protein
MLVSPLSETTSFRRFGRCPTAKIVSQFSRTYRQVGGARTRKFNQFEKKESEKSWLSMGTTPSNTLHPYGAPSNGKSNGTLQLVMVLATRYICKVAGETDANETAEAPAVPLTERGCCSSERQIRTRKSNILNAEGPPLLQHLGQSSIVESGFQTRKELKNRNEVDTSGTRFAF